MAKNTDNGRRGLVKNRCQYYDEIAGAWLKRDTLTGRILESKKGEPWKGIRLEKSMASITRFPDRTPAYDESYVAKTAI